MYFCLHAERHGNAERLALADDDVGIELARWAEQGATDGIDTDDKQRPFLVSEGGDLIE